MNIQFASTINKKYVDGCLKFLKSLKNKNPTYDYLYNFFIIDNSLTEDDKTNITSIYKNSNFLNVINLDYEYDSLSKKWRDWGYNCFNRFDIFNIKCDKLIFFDLDMIVLSNLDDIINCDCDFGAVQGPSKYRLDHPNELYFDGGLMVISKKYLNSKTREDLISISKSKKWTSDEPVLNTYFKNVLWLSKKYNVLTSEFNNYNLDEIAVLQYVGSKKPWFSKNLIENFDDFIFLTQGGISVIKLQNLYNNIA